jgi:hypothetical protein
MRVPRSFLWMPIVATLPLLAPDARAGEPTAEDLFREGVKLYQRGEIKTACERFDQSYKLDPAPGTLFNLAGCHENDGHLWQARQEYRELADRATTAGKSDKAELARSRLVAVEARLPRIQLVFPAASNVASITVDGAPLDSAFWTLSVLVDAGSHTIELSAPGKVAVTRTVTTPTTATTVPVDVPVLVDEASAPAPPSASVAAPPTAAVVSPSATPPPGPAPVPPTSSRRTVGLVVGGAGVVGLGVGATFGLLALSQRSDASSACGASTRVCPTSAQATAAENRLGDARSSADVSTIAFVAGAAAVGIGAYLFLSAPSVARSPSGFVVVPALAAGGGGLAIAGTL